MSIPQESLDSTLFKHRSLPPLRHSNLSDASELNLVADGVQRDKDSSGASTKRSRSTQRPTEGDYRQRDGAVHGETLASSREENVQPDERGRQIVRNDTTQSRGQSQAYGGSTTTLQLQSRHRRELSVPARPSRFQEGSMNDRVSKEPPSVFIGEDEAMDGYFHDTIWNKSPAKTSAKPLLSSQDISVTTLNSGLSATSDTRQDKEPARRSGIFRFGKSLAAAFNPAHIWEDLTSKRKRGVETSQAQDDILKERKERAEWAYAEMKTTGQLAALSTPVPMQDEGPSSKIYAQITQKRSSSRDPRPGGHLGSHRFSAEYNKHESLPVGEEDQLLPPPPIVDAAGLETPAGNQNSARRLSFHFRRPSIPSLKKAKSERQLDVPRDRSALQSLQQGPAADASASEAARSLRKEISRKDLQKEQKLSKRVSDLESQLERARRQLHEIRGESTTTIHHLPQGHGVHKRAFVPGTLPSLPSERMLFPEARGANGTTAGASSKAASSKVHESLDDGTETTRNTDDAIVGPSNRPQKKKSGYYAKIEKGLTPRKRKSHSMIKDDSNPDLQTGGGQGDDARGGLKATQERRRGKKSQRTGDFDIASQADDAMAAEAREPETESNPVSTRQTAGFPPAPSEEAAVVATVKSYTRTNHLDQLAFPGRPGSMSPTRRSKLFPAGSSSAPPATAATSIHLSPVEESSSMSVASELDTVPPLPKIPFHGFDRALLRFNGSATETLSSMDVKARPRVGLATTTGQQNDGFEWPDDVF
ncbi:MAG: hypothetical protein M1816_001269 [Peltula sp. TS41687]|nr:MAG: hypothetical protein M1816_001269 [Peltula sp. TS41687]